MQISTCKQFFHLKKKPVLLPGAHFSICHFLESSLDSLANWLLDLSGSLVNELSKSFHTRSFHICLRQLYFFCFGLRFCFSNCLDHWPCHPWFKSTIFKILPICTACDISGYDFMKLFLCHAYVYLSWVDFKCIFLLWMIIALRSILGSLCLFCSI